MGSRRERKCVGHPLAPDRVYSSAHRAFSSFPDTSLFAEGDIQFSFKIRHIPPNPLYPEPPSPMPPGMESTESALLNTHVEGSNGDKKSLDSENKAEEYRKWNERGREWVYGFVWFEQRRDGGIARGYMQVSPPHDMICLKLRVEIAGHTHPSTLPRILCCSA